MWYAFIPLATAILHFSPKAVRFWSIYTSAIVASVFFVEPYVPDDYALVASHRQKVILNSTTVFMCFVLFFFFTNYIVKILKIKKYNAEPYQEIVDEDVAQESEKEENDAVKLKNLYQEIVLYFDHKKPYCDPDFTVSQLALTLKTNVSYIARSIKQEAGQNFNVFINTYRIRMIKEMMDEDYQDKYTMKYIHTSGGFRYQSTFNKVFKDIEGITPSDYIIDNKKRKEEQLNHEK
ncbi:MAG: helix-turn-helix domain-containing protein [Flavobacteriaceae bacterium]|jgi:AraC-like DNA-binding protein|nr:helix-turn-helix domain-containing protein [Flavobacteriaceae bacterium]